MEIKVNEFIKMLSLNIEDADEVFRVINANRNYLRTWLSWVDEMDSCEVVKNVISTWKNEYQNGTDNVLGVFKNNHYIGNIGLHNIKKSNNSGMIGYWLAESEQGSGIMTICVKELIAYGFSKLNLNRIYIHCASLNKKSQAIPERLNFLKEGTLRDGEYLYGQYFDLFIYGILQVDWVNSLKHTV